MEDRDQHVAFKTLKLLRPGRPQLKSPEGYLLSPAEECRSKHPGQSLCSKPHNTIKATSPKKCWN